MPSVPHESHDKLIDSFVGEYRIGLFSKREAIKLLIFQKHIEGIGIVYEKEDIDGKLCDFNIDVSKIKDSSVIKYIDADALRIIIEEDKASRYVEFPNISNCEKAIKILNNAIEINNEQKRELERKNREQEIILSKKREEEELRKREEGQKFFNKCYEFHIGNKQRPFFILNRMDLELAAIYIDENKNLNFLRIDGENQEESNGIIPLAKVHYYEKGGSVHYLTKINGKYSNFGGSFTGGTFSKKATFWGGLLFGPMGMAAGALFSHQPAQVTMPNTSFEIDSKEVKIDDRNVLLNYYSDTHKQYIDIELQADTYNFLQTYLPEKKYGIVMELEKQSAVKQAKEQIDRGDFLKTPQTNNVNIVEAKAKDSQSKSNLDNFKERIEKLKMMHEAGILTDEEFAEEKNKILKSLL